MDRLDMCNGIRTTDGEGTKEAGGRKGGAKGDGDDYEILREEYKGAVACLKKCECIIAELMEQLKSKEEVIGGLEEQIVRMSLELANSKACDQQIESRDDRIAGLERKVAEMEAEFVRMSLELASSKAFEDEHRSRRRSSAPFIYCEDGGDGDEHRAKRRVASVVDFEGGGDEDDDEGEGEGEERSENRQRPGRPRADRERRQSPRRADSMGMLREWNNDPIPNYPARSYPTSGSDWAPEAAPARVDRLFRRATIMDMAPRRSSLRSASTGYSASDASEIDSRCSSANALSLHDLSGSLTVGNCGPSSGSVLNRVASRGSFLFRRTLSREMLLRVAEDKDDESNEGGGRKEDRVKEDDENGPGSFTSVESPLRSSSRRTFLERQGVVFPRSFEEVLAKGCVSDSLSDSLRSSLRESLRDSLRSSLRDSIGCDVGGSSRGSLGSGKLDSARSSLRRSLRGC